MAAFCFGLVVVVELPDDELLGQDRRMRRCDVGRALTSETKMIKKAMSVLNAYMVITDGRYREVKTGDGQ